MKILVCGCSYFTHDTNYPGTHFTELLAQKLNATCINLACPGASNFLIRLQVQAIKETKPDLVLLGFTSPDRLEYFINHDHAYHPWFHVHNIKYLNENKCIKSKYSTISSSSLFELVKSKEHSTAATEFVKHFYNHRLQKHKDSLIAQTVLTYLESQKIPYLYTEGGLEDDEMMLFVDFKKNKVESGNPWHFTSKGEERELRTYHTTSTSQIELTEIWMEKILKSSLY